MVLSQMCPLPVLIGDEVNLENNYYATTPVVVTEVDRKQNNSATAATTEMAAEVDLEERGSDSDEIEVIELNNGKKEEEVDNGVRRYLKVIKRFGDRYERVDVMKQNQMVELEMQIMHFIKDLEVRMMKLLMDTVVQLEKNKQAEQSGSSDGIASRSFVFCMNAFGIFSVYQVLMLQD